MTGLLVVLAGCAWKGEGLVRARPLGAVVETSEGDTFRLVLADDDRVLGRLDGQIALLEGRRAFGALRVTSWAVPEGTHGMAAWIGRLEQRGVQLGLQDRNSGAWYLLDPDVWPALEGAVGRHVLVEGWVDGPHRVKVMFHQVLD